ncbi:MAG TPA: hypothetical protein VG271_13630 [Beijerinckiaceae bacterium]|nr:hypothetical protein [Beijerinckiaceae bacterium]
MIKTLSLLTFVLVFGAFALVFLSLPDTDAEAAHDSGLSNCPMQQVALDEGYGVTRMGMRPICGNP